MSRKIFCVACDKEVIARLTDGQEIYPHRDDLRNLPFWKCDTCGNYIGCHYKTKDKIKPLGIIPTKELKAARIHIHKILDPIWESGKKSRKEIYALLTDRLGWKYHTANIRSIEEARKVYRIVREISNES